MKSLAPCLLLTLILLAPTLSRAEGLIVSSDGAKSGVRTQGQPLDHGRAVETITFEGIANQSPVGTIGLATFASDWVAILDEEAGGTGHIANEPSPSTSAYVSRGIAPVTFETPVGSVSFMYTNDTDFGSPVVTFRDASGATLGTQAMDVCGATGCGNTCVGDPTGAFCAWAPISFTVSSPPGIASFEINQGTGNWTIDNLTYDTAFVPVEVQSFSVE